MLARTLAQLSKTFWHPLTGEPDSSGGFLGWSDAKVDLDEQYFQPVAIVNDNDWPALPFEFPLALLNRLGRSVWGRHKVRAVRVL